MATRMQQRRATASQWTTANPVLAAGEIGFESDTNKFKIGNGVNSWDTLDYFSTSVDLSGYYTSSETDTAISTAVANVVDTAPGVLDTLNELAAAIGDDANFVTTINTTITDGDSATLTSAQSYADTQDATTLAAANAYTDGEIAAIPAPDFTGYATETYVDTTISNLVDTAPETLNTLNELAAALGNDPNFATTVTNLVAGKADLVHTHAISDVTNLQTELDGKQTDFITTQGDLVVGNASGDASRLAIGSADQVLTSNGTTATWADASGGGASDATPTVAGVVKGTTSDSENTALGDGAFTSNTTGDYNTAVGRNALNKNTTARFNTAVGASALNDNTGGEFNTAVGMSALTNNTTGAYNTAVGPSAMYFNTGGISNAAFGLSALYINKTGSNNAAFGNSALYNSDAANYNTAIGDSALGNNTSGDWNTALGYQAAYNSTTGRNNTTLGFQAEPSSGVVSDQVTLGNGSITTLRCNQTSISSLSDVRDKTDIQTTTLGLEVIKQVRPVEFTWARRDGSMGNIPDLGFIAQELAQVEDDFGETDRLRLTLRDNPEKLEASPNRLLPVLVKAVQELSEQNDGLKARLDKLEGK